MSLLITLFLFSNELQHPYVHGVLVFEATATFVGQVPVLSLIAIFGAATTAMVTEISLLHLQISPTIAFLNLTLIS